jgi:hypothetical protein
VSWLAVIPRHKISSKIDVRWLRILSSELVHECPTTSLCGTGGSMNVRSQRFHHFKGEIHSFGCIQAANNEIGRYAYADDGDGERRERGIWRIICHAK